MTEKSIKIEVENPYNISLILTGDIHLATNYHQKMAASSKKKFNLSNIKNFTYLTTPFVPLLSSADFVIANLETAILDDEPPRYYGDLKQYHHRDFPDQIFPLLQQLNIKAVTLANNHILDYGPAGLQKTLGYLQDNTLPYIGAGTNLAEAKKALFVDFTKNHKTILKIAILSAFEYRKKYREIYKFYADTDKSGVNKLTRQTLANQIKKIKQGDPERFIIFYPHWGRDYQWKTLQQEHSAEAMIEAGANLIIGHGSHFSQDIEFMNNVPIIYGLGNFIFLTPGGFHKNPEIPSMGLIARLNFSLNNEKPPLNKMLKLYPVQANNRTTMYQPRFASNEEAFQTFNTLSEKSLSKKEFLKNIVHNKDAFGEYFNVAMR